MDATTIYTRNLTDPLMDVSNEAGFFDEQPDHPTLAEVRKRKALIRSIVKRHKGTNIRIFGSVARGEPTAHDVDLIDVPHEPACSLSGRWKTS